MSKKMMTAYIVDDEVGARGVLEHYLNDVEELTLIGQGGEPLKCISEINRLKPDLVFMDIQMPVLNGFEVIPYLKSKPMIIFCTAFDQYAIRAFQANAIHYLLKPIDEHDLAQSLEKAKNEWEKLILLEEPSGKKILLEKIIVQKNNRYEVIWIRDILYFAKEERYTMVVTKEMVTHLTNLSLSYLASRLDEDNFFRISRSEIISREMVKKFTFTDSGKINLWLQNDMELQVSRRRVKEFREWYFARTALPGLLERDRQDSDREDM